jgi:hypothetical protein
MITLNVSATSISPDYVPKGLSAFFSLSYDNVFDSDIKCFSLNLGLPLFPQSEKTTLHMVLFTQFSPDVSMFDLYIGCGLTVYTFRQILSISGNVGFNYSIILLNHFAYITDIKMNVDIPIYQGHNISFGAGLRHRNALRISNWMNLSDDYYKIYNSYFFEIGYRYIIN